MKKYILNSDLFPGDIALMYDFDGVLCSVSFPEGFTAGNRGRFLCKVPMQVGKLSDFFVQADGRGFLPGSFTILSEDYRVPFDQIWSTYGYKVGKAEALAFYKRMKSVDTVVAYTRIPAYKAWCAANNKEMKYLVRYLRHRTYEDEILQRYQKR